jgi:hypothetical protein
MHGGSTVMSLRLIGIVLISVIGFAQTPAPRRGTGEIWRMIRNTLTTTEGDRYFQQIKGSQIPPAHQRFSGNVVSQSLSNELIVSVDDPAGDARLHFLFLSNGSISAGTAVHFEGVVRSYTANPYKLTFDVLPADIDSLL